MEALKRLIEKLKVVFRKTLAWLKKALRFLKKWWAHIINLIVLFVAYDFYSDSLLIGLWLFLLLAYYLFYKLLGGESLLKKDE